MADGEGSVPTSLSTGDRDWIERLIAARVEEVTRSRPPPPATPVSDGGASEGSTSPIGGHDRDEIGRGTSHGNLSECHNLTRGTGKAGSL